MNQWWGYLHTDGTIHAKRYFDERDLDDAAESPFVERFYGPFDAESSSDARILLRKHFSEGKEVQ